MTKTTITFGQLLSGSATADQYQSVLGLPIPDGMLVTIAQLALVGWRFHDLGCQLRRANIHYVELIREGDVCRIDRVGNIRVFDEIADHFTRCHDMN